MSAKAFQGMTSILRFVKEAEITDKLWAWNGKDIPGRGNFMCKQVEERAYILWELSTTRV